MYTVLRPRGNVGLRWHTYGFQEPEDVVESMLNEYLDGLLTVRHIDFERFPSWQNAEGWRVAAFKDMNTEIARQYIRTAMWQDRELTPGCRAFVERHYDGGNAQTCAGHRAPYLIHPATE